MATFTVTTTRDVVNAGDGVLSLREAIAQANATTAADTINFAAAVEGKTLVLTRGELTITRDLAIDGNRDNNASRVTIDGGDDSRLVMIGGTGTDVTLTDLTLQNGNTHGEDGGGIFLGSGDSLTLNNSRVSDNSTGSYYASDPRVRDGGGIFAAESSRLIVRNSQITGNYSRFGGGIDAEQGTDVRIENSLLQNNVGAYFDARHGGGGGLFIDGGTARISRSTIDGNTGAYDGGGILARSSTLAITNSTISGNIATGHSGFGYGGGIGLSSGTTAVILNSTITGNLATYGDLGRSGGGIEIVAGSSLSLSNTIVAGNRSNTSSDDILGTITSSNGHNIFGTDVQGNVAGDLENVSTSLLFAGLDRFGGGQLAMNGGPTPTVALRNIASNPALGGADPDDAPATDQRGVARPQPAGTDPDVGAFELRQGGGGGGNQPTSGDDVLIGTSGSDTIDALAGNDAVRGGGGNDTLGGGEGNDFVAGEAGNDRVNGAPGNDRVEGGIGNDNVRGGPGTDLLFGNAGRDVFDFDRIGDSSFEAGLDRIADFVRGTDRIDLSTIDANLAAAGNQAFSFIGGNELAGAGQVRAFVELSNTIIEGSVDRDSEPEFLIVLTGNIPLGANDFVL